MREEQTTHSRHGASNDPAPHGSRPNEVAAEAAEITLFVDECEALKLSPSTTILELKILVLGADGEGFVFLEESEDHLRPELTLIAAGVKHGSSVHVGKHRTVEVKVRYGGQSKEKEFAASATVAKVKKWVVEKLGVADPGDHQLALPSSETPLGEDVRIGTLATKHGRELVLDLRLFPRVQG